MIFSASKASLGERDLGAFLRSGASVLAICTFAAAAPALAQTGSVAGEGTAGTTQAGGDQGVANSTDINTGAPTNDEAIVITGIRQSLANSQNIKRNSDTVVDAITASDIGALPDRSVTEALQRVPGVAMNRFAGSNDPDHFSVEGSGVVIRGLSFVRSEFNGRDTFSTGVYGQSINFSDVPAELLGSVEVYKNLTAEMIEGGLSGTVNLNTRLPFDNKGFHVGFDIEANWGDMRKKWTPVGSLLVSNTWDTGIGRIGVLADISYSQLKSQSDGIQVTNFQQRNGTFLQTANNGGIFCRVPLPSSTDTEGFPPTTTGDQGDPCFGAAPAGANGDADYLDQVYAPLGGQFRTQDYNRERTGVAAAFQWESLDRRSLVTAQFLRTDSTNRWGEHTFESAPDLAEYNTFPAGCRQNGAAPGGRQLAQCRINSAGQFYFVGNDRGNGYNPTPDATYDNYSYDEDGIFESGYITLPGSGWRTADSGSATTRVPTGGIQQSLSRRQVDDENIVDDYGLNWKFTPDDHWQFNVDAQRVEAQHDTLDMSVFGSTFADNEVDITGNLPVIVPHKPLTLSATWAAPNPDMAAQTDAQYFSDPRWTFWRAAMDHIEHSKGAEWAFKGDVAYNFNNDGFLKRVKFGARYSDRDQNVRYSTYNWGAISEIWSGRAVFMDNPASAGQTEFFNFPDFFRGDTPGPVGGFYYKNNLIQGYEAASTLFKQLNDVWHNENGATSTNRWVPLAERAGAVAGTDFLPSEIQDVSERNASAYAMLSFGSDEPIFGNVRLEGNIGVRYFDTKIKSLGSIVIPSQANLGVQDPFSVRCAPTPPPPGAPPGTPPSVPGGICNIGQAAYEDLQQFAGNGSTTPDLAKNDYHYFLPSLNLKFGLTDDLILRFAASRAIARPGMADIRNFIQTSVDPSSPTITQATTGNPFLKPATSDQFDLTAEWYFARVGSLTFDAFYKEIRNFFYSAVVNRDITNNGITETFGIRGPANYDGKGKVKGFEVAYQQTWDFLPGFLSGLGGNFSYTFIKSKGLPNSQLNNGAPVNNPLDGGPRGGLPLEQLSKHNINATLFYEKGPVSLRAAYNWRSRFLLTSADVIFPYYPIFNEATGNLDASVMFNVTKSVKVGVQGVNLLNEVLKTSQMFTTDGLRGPRSYFINDRRFSFIIRGNF